MALNFNWEKTNALARELGGRVALLEELVKAHNNELTYSQIQMIVKEGLAPEFFDIGDEIMTKYTATNGTEYDFPWLVVDFRDVTWEDQSVHPGMILQSKYATLEAVPFDAVESELVDSETETVAQEGWYYFGRNGLNYTVLNLNAGDEIPFTDYANGVYKNWLNNAKTLYSGYNNYKMSAIRQWLNSDALLGEWWHSAHFGDKAPEELNIFNGFVAGFSDDFVNLIVPIRIEASTNIMYDSGVIDIMYDRFFLPSIEEMYGSTIENKNVSINSSSYFLYWKNKTELEYPSNVSNSGRIVVSLKGQVDLPFCRLRTIYYKGTDATASTNMTTGAVGSGADVDYAIYALPCCCIS